MPKRCICGSWYKLLEPSVYEKERMKYWETIKDLPENRKLLDKLTELEQQMLVLIEKGSTYSTKDPDYRSLLISLSCTWDDMKEIYVAIRKQMFP